jgi:hypothetical protein
MVTAAEALAEAQRAHTRVDGVDKSVGLLRDDLRAHRQENVEIIESGFTRVHDRIDDVYGINRKAVYSIIGILLAAISSLLAIVFKG